MLRGYQQDLYDRCELAWDQGKNVVMPVCATGSGKTVVMMHGAQQHIGREQKLPGVLGLAHRGALIAQMSKTFAGAGIPHDIIGSQALIRTIVSEHMEEFGRTFYNPRSIVKVGSVDTLPNRADLAPWLRTVGLGLGDEGHHYLKPNKWGRAYGMVSENARWMLPTATPDRADGKGLGRDYAGIVDELIVTVGMRWLIDNGYLTDYVVRAPIPSDLDLSDVDVGASGEYNVQKLRKAVHRSAKIIANIVDTYKEFTPGKLGIAFAVDVEHGKKLTEEFNRKGVPAAFMDGTMPEEQRRIIMRKYRTKEILVLVNVDLFGEGFDLPAIEVVMFGRPTASYALYAQQFGRALRLMIDRHHMERWDTYTVADRRLIIAQSLKSVAYVHDHVGNLLHFNGPPDKPREWSLADRSKRSGPSDAVPMRVCINHMCNQPYERFYPSCPYCGVEPPPPAERSLPKEVDGDLTLYTPEMLQAMFGVTTVEDAFKVAGPPIVCAMPPGLNKSAQIAITQRHQQRHREQQKLDGLMKIVLPPTRDMRENMRRFFHGYGVDIVEARRLGAKETEDLNRRILDKLSKPG